MTENNTNQELEQQGFVEQDTALESMRASDFDCYSAYGEVIDNSIQANANDIIIFDGSDWVVDFDSEVIQTIQFVTNLTTGVQYRYLGNTWIKSYEGWYAQGDYSIVI